MEGRGVNFRSRAETLAWGAQRASAAVLAACVLVHLATILYAVRGGLTAAEILGRTRGSAALALFYGTFVVAVAIHAPLGLRTIARETFGWRGASLDAGTAAFALFLAWFGWRAIGGLFG
jgi:fumarate reductase subunit C